MAGDKATAARLYDAVNRGDVETVLAAMDESIEFNVAEHSMYWTGEPFRGRQAVLEGVLGRLAEDFDDFKIDVERLLECPGSVVAQLRYRAKAKANGKLLDAQVAHVLDFDEGRIVRFQQYIDTWQSAEVTGKVGQPKAVTTSPDLSRDLVS